VQGAQEPDAEQRERQKNSARNQHRLPGQAKAVRPMDARGQPPKDGGGFHRPERHEQGGEGCCGKFLNRHGGRSQDLDAAAGARVAM